MQSARIWFKRGQQPFDLLRLKEFLEASGLTVRNTEWQLQSYIVPQLHIATEQPFLIQLNDDEYVDEEAEEFSEWHKNDLAPETFLKLNECNVRFEIGDGNDTVLTTSEGIFSFVGQTSLDPSLPEMRRIFISITEAVDGVFEDNVNGFWWYKR
ncbi:hypothetical protein [uncultured Thioclava sp.]|uniref:hypothetical protein n=1 Tax=uncultured Thioclava sp. TaxID=473858 RepID=UPI0025DFF9BA|nr:hypothetical protein [uncultured Thioclava sp.]